MPRRGNNAHVWVVQNRSSSVNNLLECGFYGSLCYSIMGAAYGFTAGFVGVGFLSALVVACGLWHGSQVTEVYRPIVLPLLCGAFFIATQLLIHGESLLDEYVRGFVTWMLTLMVAQSLSLRLGFFHRFAFVALLIGLALLPFMRFSGEAVGPGRAELDRSVGLNNSNEFGAWFGFCALYFLILGIETQRTVVRIATWLVTGGCLLLVGLTVSRGALFAVTVGGCIASRRLLKRGFAPLLLLVICAGAIYQLGLLDRFVASYEARATEETGRLLIWPIALNRFLNSPLMGVGVSDMGTYVVEKHRVITPHNAFLFMALSSGILPVTFFSLYWWRTIHYALSVSTTLLSVAPFALPLCIYCLLMINTSNFPFMSACVVVTMTTIWSADTYARLRSSRVKKNLLKRRRLAGQLATRQGFARAVPQFYPRPTQ